MIIIGFTAHTSKIIPRILCRRFRHCAVIVPNNRGCLVMYQFVHHGRIAQIQMRVRDLEILRMHGWRFVSMPLDLPVSFNELDAHTCVDLAKRAIGIHAWHIQTPYGLYKKIRPMGGFFNCVF